MSPASPDAAALEAEIRKWTASPIERSLVDSVLHGIMITDVRRRVVWINAAFVKISGYELEEIAGRNPGSFMQGPGTDPAAVARIRTALEEARPVSEHLLNYRKDGETLWIRLRIDPIRADDGSLLGFIGSSVDATHEKRLERQLERNWELVQDLEQKQRKAEEGMDDEHGEAALAGLRFPEVELPGSIFEFTTEGARLNWTHFPRSAARLARSAPGFRLSHRIRPCLGIFAKGDRRRVLAEFRRAARDLRPLSFICALEGAPGEGRRWLSIAIAPRREQGGRIRWFGSLLDETQRVLAERDLESKSRLLSLIVEITTEFIDAGIDRKDALIEAALARVGTFFGVDRAFIFTYDFEARSSSNTHEWVSEGTAPFKDILQEVPMEGMEEWVEAHLDGRNVNIPNVSACECERARSLLEMQGIKSVLAVPMMADGACLGFVGFDGVHEARAFTGGEIAVLQVFAKNLVALGERCRVTEELEASQGRLLEVIAAAGEYVWEIDPEGRFTYLSEGSSPAFGRSPESLLGRSVAALAPASAENSTRAWIEELVGEPAPFDGRECFIELPGKRIGTHLLTGVPLFSEDGSLLGYRGMGMDITRERSLSTRLRKAEDEMRLFFEVSLDLLVICDSEGRILRQSKSWEDVMAAPLSMMLGRNLLDLVAPDDRERTERELSGLDEGERVLGFVNRWISGDGRPLLLEWTAVNHQGLLYLCGRDVSLREEAETKMRSALEREKESSDLKGKLVAMASHEFRTPIAAIRLAAEMLETRVGEDEWSRAKLDTISAKTDFLESVVSDILDLERLGRRRDGKGDSEHCQLKPLSEVVLKVCEDLQDGWNGRRRLVFDLGAFPGETVRCDLVSLVVRNLVENALKYSPENEEVVVKTAPCEFGVSVSVIDRGPGIPVDEADAIFTEFFRGENSEFVRGTGLGLPIAKKAASLLGGVLFYKRGPAESNVFTLQFPAESVVERP